MTRHDALSSPVSGYDGLILTLVYDQSQIYILQIIHKVLSHDIIQQILLNIFSRKIMISSSTYIQLDITLFL